MVVHFLRIKRFEMVERKEISVNFIGCLSSNIISLRVHRHLTKSIIFCFHAEYQNLMELCSKRLDFYIRIVLVLNSKFRFNIFLFASIVSWLALFRKFTKDILCFSVSTGSSWPSHFHPLIHQRYTILLVKCWRRIPAR